MEDAVTLMQDDSSVIETPVYSPSIDESADSPIQPCFVRLIDIRLSNDGDFPFVKDELDEEEQEADVKLEEPENNFCFKLEDEELPDLQENITIPKLENNVPVLGERNEIFCSLCKKQIPKIHFFRHRMNCSGADDTENFHCDVGDCNAEFPTNRGLKKHQNLVHEVPDSIKEEEEAEVEEHEENMDGGSETNPDDLKQETTSLVDDKENEQFLAASDADSSSMFERIPPEHDEERMFKCPMDNCKSRFTTKHYLYIHTSRVHTEPVKCPFDDCNKFLKPISVNHHIKSFHQKVRKKCDNCGKLVMWSYFKTHHEKCQSVGTRNFKCSYQGCDAAFASEHNRYSHIKSVHEKVKKLCKYCGKRISSKNISKHYKICPGNGVRRYLCPADDCDAEFTTKSYLIRHAKRAHGESLGSGDLTFDEDCDESSNVDPLAIDMADPGLEVDDNELIQGIVLANASSVMDTSERRIIDDDREKVFTCDVDNCNTRFRSKGALCCHRYSVHKPPMKCPIDGCESVFKPFNLRQHMKLVHERRRVMCQNCGKHVSYTNFKLHYNNCTGDKVKRFACDMTGCQAKFWEKRGLKNHVRTVHGGL